MNLFTITVEDVKRYRDWMEAEGQAPKTMNRRLSSLASLYKYIRESAAELRLPITIPNPAHAQFIGRPSVDPVKETTALSPSRVHQLLNLVEGDHIIACRDRAILKTLLYAGLRVGTLCKLRVSDFTMDDEQSILRINEKGDKRRSLGVHYNAAEAINEYIEKAGITRGPLFRPAAGSRSKRPLAIRYFSTPAMYKLLMGYLEQLPGAIKPVEETGNRRYADCIHSPHTLRATPATLLLSNGVDLRKVQEFLGHRHSTTTQVYDKRRLGTKESASHDVTY